RQAAVVVGGEAVSAQFGFSLIEQPDESTLRLLAYQDKDGDKTFTAADALLPGITTYLDLNDNGVFENTEPTAVTGSDGFATYAALTVGTYRARIIAPSGYTLSVQPDAKLDVIKGGTATGSFGLTAGSTIGVGTASMSGYVVNDKNGDGLWSTGEAGIAGRSVWIDLNNDASHSANEPMVLTASNGKFSFTQLPAATFFVRQVLPAGWRQTKLAAGAAISVKTTAGANRAGVDFFTTPDAALPPPPPPPPSGTGSAVIRGYVVNDRNKDGFWSSGETGITNRTVWLDENNNGIRELTELQQTTGTNGVFTFSNLAAGTYYFRQVLPSGWNQYGPANAGALKITVLSGQTKSGSYFATAFG
ncbi:MAG TPA: SdrD B-like domain-containing protein, partial [Tepidisphaeraceae bacterium]